MLQTFLGEQALVVADSEEEQPMEEVKEEEEELSQEQAEQGEEITEEQAEQGEEPPQEQAEEDEVLRNKQKRMRCPVRNKQKRMRCPIRKKQKRRNWRPEPWASAWKNSPFDPRMSGSQPFTPKWKKIRCWLTQTPEAFHIVQVEYQILTTWLKQYNLQVAALSSVWKDEFLCHCLKCSVFFKRKGQCEACTQGAQSPMWFGSWILPGEEGKFWPEYHMVCLYKMPGGKLRSCMNLTHWTRKRGPSTKDRGSKRKKSRKCQEYGRDSASKGGKSGRAEGGATTD